MDAPIEPKTHRHIFWSSQPAFNSAASENQRLRHEHSARAMASFDSVEAVDTSTHDDIIQSMKNLFRFPRTVNDVIS